MYICLILLALAIIIGIIVFQNTSDSIENKVGGFFQGFFMTLVIGGLISLAISFIISAGILDRGDGKLESTATNAIVRTSDDPNCYAFQVKGKLSFVYSTSIDPNKFKESLSDLKLIPLKKDELPYMTTHTYVADTHWSFLTLHRDRYEIHINQDQIKILYDVETKVEK